MTGVEPPEGEARGGQVGRPERSVGELFTELATETSTLVRQEMKLATTELAQKATFAGRQAIVIVAGALLGVVSLLALLGALIFGLATIIALWKSALLVGVVAALVAILAIWKGLAALRDMKLAPQQTIESIKEDKQWIEQQVR